jgi:hypothetical protein
MAVAGEDSDIEIIELSQTDVPLLRRLYESMQGVFGEDELDDFDTWADELTGRHAHCRILSAIALGEKSSGKPREERPIIGGALWEYFIEAECFLYTYLFLDPAMSHGRGLGRYIANAMWAAVRRREKNDGWVIRAIFVEMHDPELAEDGEGDSMDPVKRVQMFHHLGVRQVGRPKFQYFQPPLHLEDGQTLAEAEHCPFLMGCVVTRRIPRDVKTGEPYVPTETLVGFLRAYYHDCLGARYEDDPYYRRMLHAIQTSYADCVPLVEFDCLQGRQAAAKSKL